MKYQTHPASLWHCITLTALLIIVLASKAFGDTNSCANPYDQKLTLDGQVKMRFCDIPAAKGILVGIVNGNNGKKFVKRDYKKFQIAQFEVTQLQYQTVMGNEPWKKVEGGHYAVQEGNDYPAVGVSSYDAEQFANWLSKIDKTSTYRLPTEAEFQYAASTGNSSNYYWGDEMDYDMAYFSDCLENFAVIPTKKSPYVYSHANRVDSCPNPIRNQTNPGYCANGFGLFHMLGNVQELTSDSYWSNYNMPTGTEFSDGNQVIYGRSGVDRIVSGGSWATCSQIFMHVSDGSQPTGSWYRGPLTGFRLVRIAK